jgi:hypothetical protein
VRYWCWTTGSGGLAMLVWRLGRVGAIGVMGFP